MIEFAQVSLLDDAIDVVAVGPVARTEVLAGGNPERGCGCHLPLKFTSDGQHLSWWSASFKERERGAAHKGGFMNAWVRRTMGAGAGITLGLLAGAAVLAQSQASSADNATQPQHKIQMVQAQATLDSTLDAKKAKQGEPVTAKLEGSVQIPDAQALPKNTVLEGHVDQVQASEHKSDSLMVVTFDKAKLKDGQELPIKATIIAVSEPAMMAQQAAAGTPASEGAADAERSAHRRRSACRRRRDGRRPQHAERPEPATDECACGRVRYSADRADRTASRM